MLQITQRPIKGEPEICLGVWKDWANFMNDKPQYHTMLYDRGQQCLNHYQRFAYVSIKFFSYVQCTDINNCVLYYCEQILMTRFTLKLGSLELWFKT